MAAAAYPAAAGCFARLQAYNRPPDKGNALAAEIHEGLIDDVIRRRGVAMLIGARDTGKTSFARKLLAAAISAGRTAAYIDADLDQTVTGPPTCVGLDLSRADAIQFVGSNSPEGMVLQQVVGTSMLVDTARREVDLVVIDTTSDISGVAGQALKYHKTLLCRPDVTIGFQRGAELEPLVGMLRRFFSADVEVAPVDPDLRPPTPEERKAKRTEAFAEAFAEPLQRWRVRSTVFAPTLPAGLDLAGLDGVLVGVMNGSGKCLGLGALEHDDGILRVITNAGEGMRGLRLGSLTIDLKTFDVHRVKLRDLMFGVG
jgi:polynucleotide 5'-kinase involved in rRNA processing